MVCYIYFTLVPEVFLDIFLLVRERTSHEVAKAARREKLSLTRRI